MIRLALRLDDPSETSHQAIRPLNPLDRALNEVHQRLISRLNLHPRDRRFAGLHNGTCSATGQFSHPFLILPIR